MKYVKTLKNIREEVSKSRKSKKSDLVTEKNIYTYKKNQESDQDSEKFRALKNIKVSSNI